MKPIPQELQAYFPKVINADRPWWSREVVSMGFFVGTQWSRPDGYETMDISECESIDKANPLPPPPILVGQVWGAPLSGGRWRVSVIAGVVHESDGTLTVTFANDRIESMSWLYMQGILLSCPFGYAPWSGPEVTP